MDDDARTTGMGLWTDAREMLAAAALVAKEQSLAISSPTYYLLGHGLEVALKAFLRATGSSLRALRALGHDLDGAVQAANARGLEQHFQLTANDIAKIALLNQYYKAKHFEYRVTGYQSLPPPPDFIAVGQKLLAAIRPLCEASVGVVRT